jgi:hypothetical protein
MVELAITRLANSLLDLESRHPQIPEPEILYSAASTVTRSTEIYDSEKDHKPTGRPRLALGRTIVRLLCNREK